MKKALILVFTFSVACFIIYSQANNNSYKTLDNNESRLLALYINNEEIEALDYTLHLLENTKNPWVVIQCMIKLESIAGSIELYDMNEPPLPKGEDEQWWHEESEEYSASPRDFNLYLFSRLNDLAKIIIGFTSTSYDCGSGTVGGIHPDKFLPISLNTAGTADEEFIYLVQAIGCDNGFTQAYGNSFGSREGLEGAYYSSLGNNNHLNYFKHKSNFDKYDIYSDDFKFFNNEEAKVLNSDAHNFIKGFLMTAHFQAMETFDKQPNQGIIINDLFMALDEVKSIINAELINESEVEKLKQYQTMLEAKAKQEEP